MTEIVWGWGDWKNIEAAREGSRFVAVNRITECVLPRCKAEAAVRWSHPRARHENPCLPHAPPIASCEPPNRLSCIVYAQGWPAMSFQRHLGDSIRDSILHIVRIIYRSRSSISRLSLKPGDVTCASMARKRPSISRNRRPMEPTVWPGSVRNPRQKTSSSWLP